MDSDLRRVRDAIASAIQGMSVEELSRHPEGKWSIAEILEHLHLTYTGTIKGFERLLREGKPLARRASMQERVRAAVVTGFGYMPEGRKAPERTVPRGMPARVVADSIAARIEAMSALIAQAEARFGRVRILTHPVLGPLTARQWRRFHRVHGMHHVKQIHRLRAQP